MSKATEVFTIDRGAIDVIVRNKTISDLVGEVGAVTKKEDEPKLDALVGQIHRQVNGIEQRIIMAALLMLVSSIAFENETAFCGRTAPWTTTDDSGYYAINEKGKMMQDLIMCSILEVDEIPAGFEVSFINGNTLDCRRANLVLVPADATLDGN